MFLVAVNLLGALTVPLLGGRLAALLALLDRRDQVALAHAGGVGDAELGGELPQVGEHHAGETGTAAGGGPVLSRRARRGCTSGLGPSVAGCAAINIGHSGVRRSNVAEEIGFAHKDPS